MSVPGRAPRDAPEWDGKKRGPVAPAMVFAFLESEPFKRAVGQALASIRRDSDPNDGVPDRLLSEVQRHVAFYLQSWGYRGGDVRAHIGKIEKALYSFVAKFVIDTEDIDTSNRSKAMNWIAWQHVFPTRFEVRDSPDGRVFDRVGNQATDLLHGMLAEVRAARARIVDRGGRQEDDSFTYLLFGLADPYEECSGKSAVLRDDRSADDDFGPFVDFAFEVVNALPQAYRRSKRAIREVLSRRGLRNRLPVNA